MWMFNGKLRILSRNGKQFVYLPAEIIQTPALADVGKMVQETTNLKQAPSTCKEDGDGEIFVEVNTGSALTEPRFHFTKSDGTAMCLSGDLLTSYIFNTPVKCYFSIKKILKVGAKFSLRLEDVREGKEENNWEVKPAYNKPRYSQRF